MGFARGQDPGWVLPRASCGRGRRNAPVDEPRQTDEIVGGHREGEGEAHAGEAAAHRPGEAADGLGPAEGLLDQLALLLALRVARVPRGTAIDGRAAALVDRKSVV